MTDVIVGVGVDICLIEPIRRSIRRFGDDWLNEVFTKAERDGCTRVGDPYVNFAVIFAFKEASSKALGSGFAGDVARVDFEVTMSDKVSIALSGGALRRAVSLAPEGIDAHGCAEVDLSHGWVLAYVAMEKSGWAREVGHQAHTTIEDVSGR